MPIKPMPDWLSFLSDKGATFKDGIVVSFGETPADYRQFLQEDALYDLNDSGLLSLEGPDSAEFLQGQTTADFDQLSPEHPIQGAFCNLQGRMLCDFTALMPESDRIILIIPKALIPTLITEVAKYAAFSKTELSDVSDDYYILGLSGPNSTALMSTHYQMSSDLISMTTPSGETLMSLTHPDSTTTDERALVSRYLLVIPMESAKDHWVALEKSVRPLGLPCWHLLDIHAGLGHVYPQTSAAFIPQMLNYDMTGVVSFTKGCYTGQEIVARMQYRGKLKRRLYRLMLTTTAIPLPGTEIKTTHDNKAVGQVVLAAPSDKDHVELLAVLIDMAAGETSKDTDDQNRVTHLNFTDQKADEKNEVAAQFLALPYANSNHSADS